MLAAGAAEAVERVAGDIVAALPEIFLIAFAMFSTVRMKPSAISCGLADVARGAAGATHGFDIERKILPWAEDARK